MPQGVVVENVIARARACVCEGGGEMAQEGWGGCGESATGSIGRGPRGTDSFFEARAEQPSDARTLGSSRGPAFFSAGRASSQRERRRIQLKKLTADNVSNSAQRRRSDRPRPSQEG